MHNAQRTCITCSGIICLRQTSPSGWAHCSFKKVVWTLQYQCYPISHSQDLLFGTVLQPLSRQGSCYIDLELTAIITKVLYSVSEFEAHRRQLLLLTIWHGRYSRLCAQHRHILLWLSSRTSTLRTHDSLTVTFFAPSFPCHCAIDSSAALQRSQSSPLACAGDDLCS